MPFSPPVRHVLSELFAVTHTSWVALDAMAHSFIELHMPLCHNRAVLHEMEILLYIDFKMGMFNYIVPAFSEHIFLHLAKSNTFSPS